MSSKKKVKLNKSPEINLIWADDEVQLLLESFRNFKTKKAGKGIRWENLKEKYKKIKDIFTENLPQQYNENEFPHSLELLLLTKLKRLDQNINRRWILVEEVIERDSCCNFFNLCFQIWPGLPATKSISSGVKSKNRIAEDNAKIALVIMKALLQFMNTPQLMKYQKKQQQLLNCVFSSFSF